MTYISYFRNYYDLFLYYLTTLSEREEFKSFNGSSGNAKDRLIWKEALVFLIRRNYQPSIFMDKLR